MIQITDAPLLAGTMSRPGSNHRAPQEKDAQVLADTLLCCFLHFW